MQKWEYMFIENTFGYDCGFMPAYQNRKKLKFDEPVCAEEYCNELGQEGWELVCTVDKKEAGYLTMIFKRLIR
jgi:hypothetical protein